MECINCKKEVGENNKFCPYCGSPLEETGAHVIKDNNAYSNNNAANTNNSIDGKYGFSRALTAVILSVVGFIFSIATIVTAFFAWVVALVLLIITITLTVISLINGIKSIKAFMYAKNNARVKPIATLVLGIVACAITAFNVIFILMDVIYVYAGSLLLYV